MLSQSTKFLTYKGKLIILTNPIGGGIMTEYFPDNTIDPLVENDAQWMGNMPSGGAYIPIANIHNDDGSIVQESQCVLESDVPSGILFRYVNEPAYYV